MPEFISVCRYYAVKDMGASVSSLLFLDSNMTVPIGIYLMLNFLLRMTIAVMAAFLIIVVSRKAKQQNAAMIISGLITLTPVAWTLLF